MSKRVLSPVGKWFSVIAVIEGITWAGLLLGMVMKYQFQVTEGVWLFGRLHGIAFIAYVLVTVIAGIRLRWPLWAFVLALLAAIPPLVTVPLEWWYGRRGLLS